MHLSGWPVKTIYTTAYRSVLDSLIEARKVAGLTQQEVADRLKKPQSYIAKVENAERRLDLIEFVTLSIALDIDPAPLVRGLRTKLKRTPSSRQS